MERIKSLDEKELVKFLQNVDFTRNFPIIEGIRFYSAEDIYEWLNSEESYISLSDQHCTNCKKEKACNFNDHMFNVNWCSKWEQEV